MRKMRISVNYADPHRRILSDAMYVYIFFRSKLSVLVFHTSFKFTSRSLDCESFRILLAQKRLCWLEAFLTLAKVITLVLPAHSIETRSNDLLL